MILGIFIKEERFEWSRRLNIALKNLSKWKNSSDNKVWEEEMKYSESNN